MDTTGFCSFWILWIKHWAWALASTVGFRSIYYLGDWIWFQIRMLSWLCMSLIHTLIKINKDRWPESVNGHILFRFGPKIFHVFCSLFNYSSANRHALALVWRNGNCPRCHLSQLLQCFTSVSQSPWQTSTSFIIMYTGWELGWMWREMILLK